MGTGNGNLRGMTGESAGNDRGIFGKSAGNHPQRYEKLDSY